MNDKKYCKFRNSCQYTRKYRDATHSIHDLKYSVSRKISVNFHNGLDPFVWLPFHYEKGSRRI